MDAVNDSNEEAVNNDSFVSAFSSPPQPESQAEEEGKDDGNEISNDGAPCFNASANVTSPLCNQSYSSALTSTLIDEKFLLDPKRLQYVHLVHIP